MITRSRRIVQRDDWTRQLRDAIGDPDALADYVRIPRNQLPGMRDANRLFRLKAPLSYLDRIDKGNPDDPLLKQILPVGAEATRAAGFSPDPVGDLAASPRPGIIHKYHGRALLVMTGACAIHCRYCFRRNFPYRDQQVDLEAVRAYLTAHAEIHELILSGGDPLTLLNTRLAELIEMLESVPHPRTLRIHSRLPIVLPDRLDAALGRLLGDSRLKIVLVVHANHPRELAPDVTVALRDFRPCCDALLNQSVLLRGVNDDADILAELSHRLFGAGVLPYYLHMLDKASGTAHFAVAEATASDIHRRLRALLPGYLVPRLVSEVSGEAAKSPLF